MGIWYSRICYILWKGKIIEEMNQQQTQARFIESKHHLGYKNTVWMFMLEIALFVICWLPFHGYFVYQFIDDQIVFYKHAQHVYLSFYWLAMSNAIINPLVYYSMNTRCHIFRGQMILLL